MDVSPTPLQRAEHRGWIEFASTVLGDLYAYETTKDAALFDAKEALLKTRFALLEKRAKGAPFFDGDQFSLVDAAFAPVFRYFDLIDQVRDHGMLDGLPKIAAWRKALATRPSVKSAVAADYQAKLGDFVRNQGGVLAHQLAKAA